MKKLLFSLIVLVFFALTQLNSVKAGDRTILNERFTSSTCVPCANANPILEAFLNSSDPEKIVNISYHMNWPAPGNDPMYLINPGDNTARRTAYGVNAIPDWFFDGTEVATSTGALQNAFNARTNVLSPITLVVSESVTGSTVTVKADIYCEGYLNNPNVTVQFAVLEKVVYYNGPNGESSFTHVMRKLLPTAAGTQATLLPGDHIYLEYSYDMNPAWNPSLIRNLVFVETSPHEILNCAYPTSNFNLISSPGFHVVNQGQSQSGNYNVEIPRIASGYNSPVTFTSEVIPAAAGINVQFTGGNVISNFPGSLALNVTSDPSVPVGEYKIVLTGTNGLGVSHKTFVNYLVGKNYITVGTSRTNPLLSFKVDNVAYNTKRAFVWDINSNHTVEAVSPQTFGNNRYVFTDWSNGSTQQSQTINIGTTVSDYYANYKAMYRLLGVVEPTGLPVSVVGANTYYDSASVNSISVSATQVSYNGQTYYFNRWEGTGSGSYTGPNLNPQVTMNEFILERAIFDTVSVGITNINSAIPDKFALYQNYPNPFNPTTNIKFDIAKSTFTSIVVYDILGKQISELVNQILAPGSYQYDFNASNFPSGIYYYRIKTDGYTEIKKMMLLK